MGIEPTWDFVEPHAGFEDQERHQVASHLRAAGYGCETSAARLQALIEVISCTADVLVTQAATLCNPDSNNLTNQQLPQLVPPHTMNGL